MEHPYPKAGMGIIVLKAQDGNTYAMLHQRKGARGLGEGYWGSGGGHLEMGESMQDGVLRELKEEAGEDLEVAHVKFLCVTNFTQMKPKHYVDVGFVADWVSGEPQNSDPEATTAWQWFDIHNLPAPLFPPLENYLTALRTGQTFFDSSFALG